MSDGGDTSELLALMVRALRIDAELMRRRAVVLRAEDGDQLREAYMANGAPLDPPLGDGRPPVYLKREVRQRVAWVAEAFKRSDPEMFRRAMYLPILPGRDGGGLTAEGCDDWAVRFDQLAARIEREPPTGDAMTTGTIREVTGLTPSKDRSPA